MLAEARERHGDCADFRRADLREPLPVPDDDFDLVLCQLVLDHVAEWEPTVAEFARVLVDGGTLVLSCDHPFTTYFVIEHEPAEVGNANADAADYYAVERFTKDWRDVEMPVYRRPLAAVTRPLFEAGFLLDALREPLPRVADENLAYFAERTPRFLALRARNGTGSGIEPGGGTGDEAEG
jgi:SAM-dependent methyltransferase